MLIALWPHHWSRQQRSNATLVAALILMVLALASLGQLLSFLPEPIGSNAQAFSDGARVTLWLTLTFIFPQLTANLNPTAAINPISALAVPPDTTFFHWAARLLGPFSLADAYKFASAGLLDYLPPGITSPSFIPPVINLILAAGFALAIAWRALTRLSMAQGDYNV